MMAPYLEPRHWQRAYAGAALLAVVGLDDHELDAPLTCSCDIASQRRERFYAQGRAGPQRGWSALLCGDAG